MSDQVSVDAVSTEALPPPPEGAESHKVAAPNDVIAALPEDARKLIANMQADYTRKTQALAEERRLAREAQAKFLSEQEAALKQRATVEEGIDLYTPEGLEKVIQARVAAALLEMQRPQRELIETQTREDSTQQEIHAFVDSHPDIEDYRAGIITHIKSGMDYKTAYFAAKAEALEAKATAAKVEQAKAKAAKAKAAAAAVRAGGQSGSAAVTLGAGKVRNTGPKTALEAFYELKAKGAV